MIQIFQEYYSIPQVHNYYVELELEYTYFDFNSDANL